MNYKEPQGYGEQGKKDYLAGWMPDEDPTDGHVVRSTDEQEVETRLALILGGMMLVGIPSGAVEGTSGGLKILLAVLYFLVFAGPALYWIYANKRDTKSVRQWAATEADYREVWESFDPATKSVFARPAPSEELPLLPKRPWLWIWIAEFAVIATAGALTPA